VVNYLLPRALECNQIDRAAQGEADLFEIDPRLRCVERLEEHYLLQRGKLADIFDVITVHWHPARASFGQGDLFW
jgi:hypothetical protein